MSGWTRGHHAQPKESACRKRDGTGLQTDREESSVSEAKAGENGSRRTRKRRVRRAAALTKLQKSGRRQSGHGRATDGRCGSCTRGRDPAPPTRSRPQLCSQAALAGLRSPRPPPAVGPRMREGRNLIETFGKSGLYYEAESMCSTHGKARGRPAPRARRRPPRRGGGKWRGEVEPRALLARQRQPAAGFPHRSPAQSLPGPPAALGGESGERPSRRGRRSRSASGQSRCLLASSPGSRTQPLPRAFLIVKCKTTETPLHKCTEADNAIGDFHLRRSRQASFTINCFQTCHRTSGGASGDPPPHLHRHPLTPLPPPSARRSRPSLAAPRRNFRPWHRRCVAVPAVAPEEHLDRLVNAGPGGDGALSARSWSQSGVLTFLSRSGTAACTVRAVSPHTVVSPCCSPVKGSPAWGGGERREKFPDRPPPFRGCVWHSLPRRGRAARRGAATGDDGAR
ncbi:uncharacterized protein LOC135179952 [Pogoniulus pusillus]|uniref:uncharacterized protein LOC135179952 n=1 Tax=Pogoniulus pusillus TaxID=488313 RepID=UPI0030B92F62